MGTEISLDIGGVSVAWSKNSMGIDHGMLFQEKDRKRFRSEQIDYDECDDPEALSIQKFEMAFVRPLLEIVRRLELLGFTIERAKQDYEEACNEANELHRVMNDSDLSSPDKLDLMSFEEFLGFIRSHSITSFSDDFNFSLDANFDDVKAVSYTHLTLPTNREV